MLRVICEEVHATAEDVTNVGYKTFDVTSTELESYLRGATPPFRRKIVGAQLLDAEEPGPDPVPEPDPVPAGFTLLYEATNGAAADENVFGMTILHAGESYFNNQMTPEGGATGGRMLFKWTRMFASWGKAEAVKDFYDWGVLNAKAAYFAQRGLHFSLVLSPVAPPHYSIGLRGPASTEAPYFNVVLAAMRKFYPLGMRAHEICNEPETDNWYGSLGHKPLNDKERRQTARELAPWARVAKEAADKYYLETGNRIEIWGTSSQSMANALPETGLARVFNDPSAKADALYGGAGFLNGSDGKGGKGARWLDRFTFHGYPSPTHDGTMLHAHFLKAKAWLVGAGVPDLPMVVTEHGVLTARGQTAGLGDSSNGSMREWKTDNPYTGKTPPLTDQERTRFILNAYAISALHGGRMIYYAWDEGYMGIFGWANGPQGKSPTAALGWTKNHVEIETKYKALREALIGKRVFSLFKRTVDGALAIQVGPTRAEAKLLVLE